MTATIIHADCLDWLAAREPNSIDAIVTDPPYNLSYSGERDANCLRQVLAEVFFPHNDDSDSERIERSNLSAPSVGGSFLRREPGSVRVESRVSVPESAVDFQRPAILEHEVYEGNISAFVTSDRDLSIIGDVEFGESLGDFILQPANGWDSPFCDGTCVCFTEPRSGLIAVSVIVPSMTGRNGASMSFVVEGDSSDILVDHNSRGESSSQPGTFAHYGAVRHAVLRLDTRRGTGELDFTNGAQQGRAVFLLSRAKDIRARTGAGSLSTVLEPYRVSVVGGSAYSALALYFPAHESKSSKGFMGKEWDGWESPASFQRWCKAWATECLKVLKPGGHLLAFGATRTWHRLAVAIEDAGFEMRDSIAWMHSQGFPKGQNLKPAFEPIVVARKPFVGSAAANKEKWGTGELDIENNRIATTDRFGGGAKGSSGFVAGYSGEGWTPGNEGGRWPANVILDESEAASLDLLTDNASRYFFVAKANKFERPEVNGIKHNTVKPITLMRHLVRLATPPGGLVVDTFAGSGATVEAAILEGYDVIGIEREAEYIPLIEFRVKRAQSQLAESGSGSASVLDDSESAEVAAAKSDSGVWDIFAE